MLGDRTTPGAGNVDGARKGHHARQRQGCLECLLLATVLALPGVAGAETTFDRSPDARDPATSMDEIALELSSSASRLRNVSWDFNYYTFQGDLPGAEDQTAIRNVLALSWPIDLGSGKNLMLRLNIPINGDQPYWKPVSWIDWSDFVIRQEASLDPTTSGFESGHNHIGSVGFDVGYGGVSDDGFISMFGIANVAPTSEDGSAKRGQWLIGPEVALGRMADWGLFSVRAKHLTSIYGSGDHLVEELDTNETTLEVRFAYALGNGWQIESNPVILYDWEALSGNKWIVPIGAGLSRTFGVGRFPMKLGFELQHFVVTPDRFGPEWLLNVKFAPIF